MDKRGTSYKCVVCAPCCFIKDDSGRHPADASSWGVHGQLDKQQLPSSPLCDIFERNSPWAAPDAQRLTHSTAPCLSVQKLTVQHALWWVPHRYKRPLYWHQGKSEFAVFVCTRRHIYHKLQQGSMRLIHQSDWASMWVNIRQEYRDVEEWSKEKGKQGDFPDIFKNRKWRVFCPSFCFLLARTIHPPFKCCSH